jgi:flagellar basal body rod protein FlgG
MCIGLHENFRYSCRILMKLEFKKQISKNTGIPNFMKIRPVRAELFHVDGRTDMTKLIVAFRNFANASKIVSFTHNGPEGV